MKYNVTYSILKETYNVIIAKGRRQSKKEDKER
jgi:hypothetical protein